MLNLKKPWYWVLVKKISSSEVSAGIQSGGEEAGNSARPRELGDSCCSHLNRIDELTAKLKIASSEIVSRDKKIAKMKELLDEKDSLVHRLASDN